MITDKGYLDVVEAIIREESNGKRGLWEIDESGGAVEVVEAVVVLVSSVVRLFV